MVAEIAPQIQVYVEKTATLGTDEGRKYTDTSLLVATDPVLSVAYGTVELLPRPTLLKLPLVDLPDLRCTASACRFLLEIGRIVQIRLRELGEPRLLPVTQAETA